jgi:hypothetical protein
LDRSSWDSKEIGDVRLNRAGQWRTISEHTEGMEASAEYKPNGFHQEVYMAAELYLAK